MPRASPSMARRSQRRLEPPYRGGLGIETASVLSNRRRCRFTLAPDGGAALLAALIVGRGVAIRRLDGPFGGLDLLRLELLLERDHLAHRRLELLQIVAGQLAAGGQLDAGRVDLAAIHQHFEME